MTGQPDPSTPWEPQTVVDRAIVALYGWLAAHWIALAVFAIAFGFLIPVWATLVVTPETGLRFLGLTGVSIVPALIIVLGIWSLDGAIREPPGVLLGCFLLAILLAGAAAMVNGTFRFLTAIPVVGMILLYFLVVGPIEEVVKLLAIRLSAYDRDHFVGPIDGAVYGAAAGLGFATIENFVYIGLYAEVIGEPAITVIRSLSGPGHVIWTALAGFYLGLAKANPHARGPLILKGILLAVLFHGTHNAMTLLIDSIRWWWAFQISWHLLALALVMGLLVREEEVQT